MSKLFQEVCTEHDDMFIILCELLPIHPDQCNIEGFLGYIRLLRKLPKPFYMHLDTTKSPFSSYMKYMPRILKELGVVGASPCLKLEIDVLDVVGLVPVINRMINLFSHEAVKIKLNVV